jgi:AcrR family transcriptional regulator
MATKARSVQRREDALSRDRIVDAAIELLDAGGEDGLTFRALSEHLATGPGAIYNHIADKDALLVAACDTLVARTLDASRPGSSPRAAIRTLALALFDAMDAHPWMGAALVRAAGQSPSVRLLERLGQAIQALGVPRKSQWAAASALLHYIVGVGSHNAAQSQFARARGLARDRHLGTLATQWTQLDATLYPFVRSMSAQLPMHDDRADFLAGIDLVLGGLGAGQKK